MADLPDIATLNTRFYSLSNRFSEIEKTTLALAGLSDKDKTIVHNMWTQLGDALGRLGALEERLSSVEKTLAERG